ncbi:MAG: glycosyltransferase [Candidatus Latescibacteria bacterium]|jgi:glycosyltransferase involved in cell wall biosynthesis|nr:glycosyltransferase [Candidatus Latescibacterota bacterium]
MKVLLVAPGSSIHANRFLMWLLKKGCNVVFMDTVNPIPDGHDNYEFVCFPRLTGRGYIRRAFNTKTLILFEKYYSTFFLKKIIAKYKPEITHVHWIDERVKYLIRAGIKPLVISGWGCDINAYFSDDADEYEKNMTGKILSSADFVISNTRKMDERCNILAGKNIPSMVLHFGINTGKFHPGYEKEVKELRSRLNIPVSTKVVLSPRAWEPLYNHLFILEAFAGALNKIHSEAVLIFILFGKNIFQSDSYEKEVRKKAEELGISKFVKFIPSVPWDEMPVLYALSDLVVNCPSRDALPGTFVEAAACCRPVVSCKLQTYEKTFAEKYFSLIEEGNINAFADAVAKELNAEISERIHELNEVKDYVVRKYDEENYAQKIIEIYNNLISNPHA